MTKEQSEVETGTHEITADQEKQVADAEKKIDTILYEKQKVNQPQTSYFPDIVERLVAIHNDMPHIGKTGFNEKQKFYYRKVEDIYNHITKLLPKHGVFMGIDVLKEERETVPTNSGGKIHFSRIKVKYSFYSVTGSAMSSTVIGEGMDAGDKSYSKAMTNAQKNLLQQTFMIATEDLVDPDADESDYDIDNNTINEKQVEVINKLLKQIGEPESFLSYYSVEKVEDISVDKYKNCVANLEKKIRILSKAKEQKKKAQDKAAEEGKK